MITLCLKFENKVALISNGKSDKFIFKLFDERIKELYKNEKGRYIPPKKKGGLGTLMNPNVAADKTVSENEDQ